MTAKVLVANLGGNNYRWDFNEFCRRVKLAPESSSATRLWQSFKQANAALGEFDAERLEAIFAPKDGAAGLPLAHAEWLNQFRQQWQANADESERNQLMDSGWSGAVADRCTRRCHELLREIVVRLASMPTLPADFFDRPELVALAEAARAATGG